MRYCIVSTVVFKKRYQKLSANERTQVKSKLRILAQDPWHPSLRTKKIRGTAEFEISVNMDIRIAIAFEGNCIILLLDIDHHEKLFNRRSRK